MTRARRVPGEKPPLWIGSSKNDLLVFPEAVKDELGTALSVAQFGGKHPHAKPWKGEGPGVLAVVEDHAGTRIGPFIPLGLKRLSMYFMRSRRNHRAG